MKQEKGSREKMTRERRKALRERKGRIGKLGQGMKGKAKRKRERHRAPREEKGKQQKEKAM